MDNPSYESIPQPPNLLIDLNQYPEEFQSPTIFFESIPQPQNLYNPNKKKKLTLNQKRAITDKLHKECDNGILSRGAITKIAEYFSISRYSVSRIWQDAKICLNSNVGVDFPSKMVKMVGRKRVEIDLESLTSIPFRRRTNIRLLAHSLGIAKSTVHIKIKGKSILPHSNAVKPCLTNDNKKTKLEFCLSMIDEGTIGTKSSFLNMYDRIHIDEKWFYMSKTSQKFYLLPDEKESYRTYKSKCFIPKIMFLDAVACPRFDSIENEGFDGKIGILPFVFKEPAKQNSKNRITGTLETKPIPSVTKDVIRSCLIENVQPHYTSG